MCRRVRWVPSVAAAALLLAGCTGADRAADDDGIQPIEVEDDEAERESEPEPEPDAEPEPGGESEPEQDASDGTGSDDPFAFDDPSDIDADYVDRVMAELLAVEAAVLDDVLESDPSEGMTEADGERLRAVLSGPRLLEEGQNSQNRATDVALRAAFLSSEERTRISWQTEMIVGADSQCVVTIGVLDNSGVAVEPYPPGEFAAVVLSRAADLEQSNRHNPTPWRIHQVLRLIYAETSEPVPPEQWPDLEFGQLLDLPCDGPIR
jgi:hypothetical protein